MDALLAEPKRIREVTGLDPRNLPASLLDSSEPIVARGLAVNWPMVRAARDSQTTASNYLKRFYKGAPVTVFSAPPKIEGRFFYDDDFTGFNFKRAEAGLDLILDEIGRAAEQPRPPAIYVGATQVDACLPGFREENDFDFGARQPHVSIWIGNRARIAAHHDLPSNLACVVAGRRRFTLFPPEQLRNLYVGPFEFNPAGQAISLVDFHAPDFAKYPRFAQALAAAQVVELEAGDALLIPSLWWHHVEGLDRFNVLVNYWWRRSPAHLDAPFAALMMTLVAVRDLPSEQRAAWQEMFRHYVFEANAETAAHIPPHARGALGPFDEESARAVRAAILARMNGDMVISTDRCNTIRQAAWRGGIDAKGSAVGGSGAA